MKSPLLKSRKFWIMLVDVIVSITTYFVTKYSNPEAAKDVLFLIGAIQPVILAVIASITFQNVEHIKQGARVEIEKNWARLDSSEKSSEETPQ